jgi:cytochrome P450
MLMFHPFRKATDMTPSTPAVHEPYLRDLADLPGPRGWPVIGNLLQIDYRRVHQDVEAWAREHGPLLRMQFGPTKFLVVSDYEAIARLLRERPHSVERLGRTREIGVELGFDIGLFDAEGDTWRRQRRMVMASFSPAHVRAYLPSLNRVTQRLQGRWERAACESAHIDLQADLMRYTVDAIAGLAFGAEINTIESGSEVIQQHLDKVLPALFKRAFSLVPWWRIVRTPADRSLERSVAA